MTDNKQQPPEKNNDPQKPEGQGGADKRQHFVKMLQRIAMMLGDDRTKMMKVIKDGDLTADGRESPQLVEVDPSEIPFKKGSTIGLSKVDLRTNTVRATMSDWGMMDEDVEIDECLSLNDGAGHTSPVEHCFLDQYGNAYVRTANSLYRLDPVEKEEEPTEALPALPYLEIDPTLPDTPMPSIEEVVLRNENKRQAEALKAVQEAGFKDIESAKRALRIAEKDIDEFAAKGEGVPNGTEEFTRWVLAQAQKGEPGLAMGKIDYSHSRPTRDIVYRGPDGMPVARASLIATVDDALLYVQNTIKITGWEVQDFATDKNKGILAARAAYAIGEELVKLDALKQSSSISPDALRLLHGYFSRQIAKLPEYVRTVLRESK